MCASFTQPPSDQGSGPGALSKKQRAAKLRDLRRAIRLQDVPALLQLGRGPGGFVLPLLRRDAWRVLLRALHPPEHWPSVRLADAAPAPWVGEDSPGPGAVGNLGSDAPGHQTRTRDPGAAPDYTDQIRLDVERSFGGCGWSQLLLAVKRAELFAVLKATFRTYPWLHYYQGYHDVGAVCYRVLGGREEAAALLAYLSLFYLRDHHQPTMASSMEALGAVMYLVGRANRRLGACMRGLLEGQPPLHCLPWLLTWFSHVIGSLDVASRVFDYLLTSDPDRIVYLCASCILLQGKHIAHAASIEELFLLLQDVSWTPALMDRACEGAEVLRAEHPLPPSTSWRSLPLVHPHSCLADWSVAQRLAWRQQGQPHAQLLRQVEARFRRAQRPVAWRPDLLRPYAWPLVGALSIALALLLPWLAARLQKA